MDPDYLHKILIADGDHKAAKPLGKLLEKEKAELVFADSGSSALKKIQQAKKPFSMIIAEQTLEGMTGTRLFEHVKKISPDTQRFLLTDFSDINTIMNAVNKGSIQRYVQKPWQPDDLSKAIRSGLDHFEHSLEHEKLLGLAKNQNAKLYDLNCQLMETTTCHNKELQELDKQIKSFEDKINALTSADTISLSAVMAAIKDSLGADTPLDNKNAAPLLHETIRTLYDQLNDIANRSGFEMPPPRGVIEC